MSDTQMAHSPDLLSESHLLRPELAPSVVTFSVPDLTYPPIRVHGVRVKGEWVPSGLQTKSDGL